MSGTGSFIEDPSSVTITGLAEFSGSGTDSISGGSFTAGTLQVEGSGTELSISGGAHVTTKVNSGTANQIGSGATIAMSGAATVLDFTNGGTATLGGVDDEGVLIGSGTVYGAISGGGTAEAKGGALTLG